MPVTIVSTQVQVYPGNTATGTAAYDQTLSNSPAQVVVGNVNLGDTGALMPGSQYCARARCTNSEAYTSDWTALRMFKTLASISFAERQGGVKDVSFTQNQITGNWELHFGDIVSQSGGDYDGSDAGTACWDANVMSIAKVFVSIADIASQNPGQSTAHVTTIQVNPADILDYQDFTVTQQMMTQAGSQFQFEESHTYYVWLGITDDLQNATRTYWTSSVQVATAVARPVITLSNPTHTYNSVGITASVASSETISSIVATCKDANDSLAPVFTKTLSTSSPQTVTFTDGDTDSNGATVVINSGVTYSVTITVATPTYPSTSENTTITTDQQTVSTIAITSIDGITPSSAAINLAYGS